MSRRLLCLTDFSTTAEYALQRAVQLSRAVNDVSLTVAHVVSGSERERSGVSRVQESLRALVTGRGCPIESVVLEGPTRAALAEFIDSGSFDLTLLGARAKRSIRDDLLGSTTEDVMTATRRPLLAVRRAPTAPYRRVLVALDSSEHAIAALTVALAWLPQAEFILFHALEADFEGSLRLADASTDRIEHYRSQRHAAALHSFGRIADSLPIPQTQRSTVVVHGPAATRVLEHAARREADLIVMGRRGLSSVQELFLGSVTRQVLNQSACDVLIARTETTIRTP